MSEGKKSIADVVRELIKARGVKSEDVYNAIGMTHGTFFNRLREGMPDFDVNEAQLLAKYFEVDFNEYFGGFYNPEHVVGEPFAGYNSTKEELLTAYRKIDTLHDKLEMAQEKEITYIKLLAKNKIEIPDFI